MSYTRPLTKFDIECGTGLSPTEDREAPGYQVNHYDSWFISEPSLRHISKARVTLRLQAMRAIQGAYESITTGDPSADEDIGIVWVDPPKEELISGAGDHLLKQEFCLRLVRIEHDSDS